MPYTKPFQEQWAFVTSITTATGDTTLVAAPGAGRRLRVQVLTVCITTSAAQAFNIEDDGASPVQVFVAPASLAAGVWSVDCGPLGVALTTNTALQFDTAAAGVGALISGFGYVEENL
mgnify:CR=1 FL=1